MLTSVWCNRVTNTTALKILVSDWISNLQTAVVLCAACFRLSFLIYTSAKNLQSSIEQMFSKIITSHNDSTLIFLRVLINGWIKKWTYVHKLEIEKKTKCRPTWGTTTTVRLINLMQCDHKCAIFIILVFGALTSKIKFCIL
jgi:hypothetical protein